MRNRCAIACVWLLSASVASPAPKPDARAEARAHYKAGEGYQRAGEHDKAVSEYLAAYELAPLPVLLFNVGQAYRLKGDKPNAVEYYKRYLAADPDGKLRDDALAHVASLTKAIEEEERQKRAAPPAVSPPPEPPKPAPPPQPVETAKSTEPAPKPPEATPAPPRATVPVKPPTPPPVDEQGGGTLRLAGIITGGVGIASLAGGVFFGLRANSIAEDVAKQYDPGKASDGESANRTMLILYGVGAAALAAGGILYYLGTQSDAEPARVTVSPVVTPDGATVSVRGVF